jgi:hypothetical protein
MSDSSSAALQCRNLQLYFVPWSICGAMEWPVVSGGVPLATGGPVRGSAANPLHTVRLIETFGHLTLSCTCLSRRAWPQLVFIWCFQHGTAPESLGFCH